jgi:hypothetical protein
MGTGLTVQEFLLTGLAGQIQRAFFQAHRAERERRLEYVIQLSVELHRIRQITIQATGLLRAAIEDVINGEWEGVDAHAKILTFQDENESLRERMAPLYAPVVETLNRAYETRPRDSEDDSADATRH